MAVRGVSRRFERDGDAVQALLDVDLELRPGEFISLVGPSGCGKSTLLNIIGGLLWPSEGEVLVEGRPVDHPPEEVGMMFQTPVLLEWRNTLENVLLPIQVHGGRRAVRAATDRARELLRTVGLEGFEKRLPHELSGGMQQRVAICRMLIADPDVLLLDEPFGALDELTREYMDSELERIVREAGKAAILVTHNIQEAVFMADRVFAMTARPGRIAGVVDVPLERPRPLDLLTDEPFQKLCRRVRALLDEGAAPIGSSAGREAAA